MAAHIGESNGINGSDSHKKNTPPKSIPFMMVVTDMDEELEMTDKVKSTEALQPRQTTESSHSHHHGLVSHEFFTNLDITISLCTSHLFSMQVVLW